VSAAAQDQRDAMFSRPLKRFGRAVESVAWNAKMLIAMLAYPFEVDLSFVAESTAMDDAKRSRRKVRCGSIGSSNCWSFIW
jgi:hypothetical protein